MHRAYLAKPHMEKSTVIDQKSGKSTDSRVRTSSGLRDISSKGRDKTIHEIEKRISDVEEGGKTVFPAAKGNYSAVPWWNQRWGMHCFSGARHLMRL
ncbi:unnamed protein product [Brassica rapa]|uniref:Uncharacterized protein n=1 Tax=Brassica campestris TaxID=3711 RepID=A0A3P5Z1K2_BRACM|nr:unnamed protein product [Brassica rapa]VDC67813.1 unnamed protein product [Brassica rapa]